LACHQNAFATFGGVPKKTMVDNLKSAVLKRAFGLQPVLNTTYVDFANHYDFKIVPYSVRKAHEKGLMKNAIGYVKNNFLARMELPDYQALNNEARHALTFNAFSCKYIANIIEQRARKTPEPSAWRLTRREDLLDIEVEAPDLDIYSMPKQR